MGEQYRHLVLDSQISQVFCGDESDLFEFRNQVYFNPYGFREFSPFPDECIQEIIHRGVDHLEDGNPFKNAVNQSAEGFEQERLADPADKCYEEEGEYQSGTRDLDVERVFDEVADGTVNEVEDPVNDKYGKSGWDYDDQALEEVTEEFFHG